MLRGSRQQSQSLSKEEEEEDSPEEANSARIRRHFAIIEMFRLRLLSSRPPPSRRRVVLGDSERDASFRGKSNGLSIPLFSSLPFPVDYWKNA